MLVSPIDTFETKFVRRQCFHTIYFLPCFFFFVGGGGLDCRVQRGVI